MPCSGKRKPDFIEIYNSLSEYYGPTGWWPGDSPFEIAIGAILTQNTAWNNVERAINNLKAQNLLSPEKIVSVERKVLEEAIKPSGYFRQKAERLVIFCNYLLKNYGGKIELMGAKDTESLRKELLSIKGIGEETADDILLYACEHPIFVVDAYTRRIFSRHGLIDGNIKYKEIQEIFHKNVPKDVYTYKEYHGLIVWTGKDFCKKLPRCEKCPLNKYPKWV